MRNLSLIRHYLYLAVLGLGTVRCSSGGEPPASDRGRLTVTTSTTGAEIDADGYNLFLNNALDRAVGANSSATVNDLDPGTVTLDLANVAGNCTVAPPRLRTLTIVADQTTQTAYDLTCFTTTGTLNLKINATGYFYDFDTILTRQIDAQAAIFTAPGFDSTFTLSIGQHVITIGQVAANCSDPSGNVRNFAITPAAETVVQFDYECTAITGRLKITALMAGAFPDADGYFVSLDGAPPGHLGSENSSVEYLTLVPGPHSIAFTGIAGNCILNGPATRQYTVVAGTVVSDTFNLDCP